MKVNSNSEEDPKDNSASTDKYEYSLEMIL